MLEIAGHLYIELANDIYKNHYDLPDNYYIGDKLKRIRDNQYYEIIKVGKDDYTLRQILRKRKSSLAEQRSSYKELWTTEPDRFSEEIG